METFSGFNVKTWLLAGIAVLTTSSLAAQDYARKIDWQPKAKTFATIDGKSVTQPTFTNAMHPEATNLLPFYTEFIPLNAPGQITVQVVNAVYAPATNIDNASLPFIKPTIEVKAELSYFLKHPSAYISLLPFRKGPSGQVERLETFTLRVSVTPKPQRRSANSYANNSVLASGTWYKMAVNSEGVYKIDYAFVKTTLNTSPDNINLNRLAIFSDGGGMVPELNADDRHDDLLENPTYLVDNNNNNRFDDGDYLLFYAQMPDQWKYNSATQKFSHVKNLYTDQAFYFLTTDAGTGKRIQTIPSASGANKTITTFDDHQYRDNDEENILKSGRTWVGDKMTSFSTTKSFSFNFPNLVTSSPVVITSSAAARTNYGSNTAVTANGQLIFNHNDTGINLNGSYPNAYVFNTLTANYNSSSDQVTLGYTFHPNADPAGTAANYVNWIELFAKRNLTMNGNAMPFRSIESEGTGNVSEFRLNNAAGNTAVWDITDIGDIKQINGTFNGSQLSFTTITNTLKEFIAVNISSAFGTPTYIGKVGNQNLHATGQPDMVIVAYDDFIAPSEELANFHRTIDGISVSVVKLSEVYNEFGGGRPDISAIRDFMRMLYDRAAGDTAKLPRYLLLMGDGSYDPKGRIASANNFVPTYQSYESNSSTSSYTSDDFFGLLDINEGGDINTTSQQMDIGVGRIPVGTTQEAWDVVNKIKNYKRPKDQGPQCVQITANNSWHNMVTFIADDLDEGGSVFETYSDGLSESSRSGHPAYNFDKIYLDAYKQQPTPAGDRYPDVNTAILNRINSGSLVINWVGHGGETNWAHERIFNLSDIVKLENKERLPLFITATCEFSRYDLPDRTAGEWLVVNGNGGAIASLTTVRLVYQYANEALNSKVFDYIFTPFEGRDPTLGELLMEAKNNITVEISNTRKFTLLGDPALQLNYPRYNVVTTEVNNAPITAVHDTLKALSRITIKGQIQDDNNNVMSGFNGVVYPIVYDKIATLQTLGNDAPQTINFKLYKNLLFKGKASVTNGQFTFTFIVPKDIDYQFGNGRISYYADNGNFTDAHGYTNNVIIGGAADTFNADADGPKMSVYMNDEKFVFGGTTNESPVLLVKMDDESGINTAGNGIGHDLTAILDDNTQNKAVLNDYYESELDNYQKGTIKYPYSKLAEGRHTLKVKAWDIQNNSTEEYTEFIVASNAKLALTHVFNYPNPFTTSTQFMFEHNKPCDDLTVVIQIYTISGKVVKTIQRDVHCEGFRVNDIEWDGRDDYGDAIGKGVYVYKINVRDSEGESAHKFEKLVVLR